MTDSNREEIIHNQNSGKEILIELEKTGDYVFHGSYQKLEEFEPRQATNTDVASGIETPDGKPAVFASTLIEPAIFRALINTHFDRTPGHWSGWDYDGENIIFKASQMGIERAQEDGVVGYVHVFSKNKFHSLRAFEFASYNNVAPIMIVEVRGRDLPEGIVVENPLRNSK